MSFIHKYYRFPAKFYLFARSGSLLIGLLILVFIVYLNGEVLAQTVSSNCPPIKSGCEYDYPPYCIVKEDGTTTGFSVDILRAALRAMGKEVEFEAGPWSEIKRGLAEGRLEALPLVGRTPEREEIFDFTFPYLTMHGAIVTRRGKKEINNLEDLRGKEVAVLREDNAAEFLLRNRFTKELVFTETYQDTLRELSAGKHDAVFIQRLVALQLIEQYGLDNLRVVPLPQEQFHQTFCFAVREGNKKLLDILNEGLAIIMAEGSYRRIWFRWFAPIEGLHQEEIKIGGDWNYPPYEFFDENGQPTGFNVDLIRESANFVLRGSNVRAEYRIAENLSPANIDVGQIKQVIQNLVINADQAMPQGGVINIKAENVEQRKTDGFLKAGRYIRIEIADRGVGIGTEHLDKIFDPYFSTKQKGSGLGLAIVDSIVRKHEGRVKVESKVGSETTFIIYLPSALEELKQEQEIDVSNPVTKHFGRIMIMDDQEEVIRVAERIVNRAGWDVVMALDGEEAVRLYFEAHAAGDRYEAVILDLTVPGGMGGKEAAKKILELDPEALLIVSSGYSDDSVVANFSEYGFKGVVTKPYFPSQLIDELERILEEHSIPG